MKKYLFALLLVTACTPVTTSSISPVQGKDGKKIGTMNITVKTQYGKGTTMSAVSTEGEIYKGQVVTDKVESESYSSGAGYSQSKSSRGTSSKSKAGASSSRSGTKYSSKAYAMLISNKGNSMECDLKLSSPRNGLAAGGSGKCKTSDGKTIPVSFTAN